MSSRLFFAKALTKRVVGAKNVLRTSNIATMSTIPMSSNMGGSVRPDLLLSVKSGQAESDCTEGPAGGVFAHSASSHHEVDAIWSNSMSFVSPESDWVSQMQYNKILISAPETAAGVVHPNEMVSSENNDERRYQESHHPLYKTLLTESQRHYLASSPESAVGVVHSGEMLPSTGSKEKAVQQNHSSSMEVMLLKESQYLVSSPESALGVVHGGKWLPVMMAGSRKDEEVNERHQSPIEALLSDEESRTYLVSSPESALGFFHAGEMLGGIKNGISSSSSSSLLHEYSSQSLFASPESATGAIWVTEMLDDDLKQALMEQQRAKDELPKTLSEALSDERPIVITSAKSPFTVVDVNAAWEGLCGYKREEALHRNLGDLLQGPETDVATAADMVRYLKRDQFSRTVLTNYTKTGRKFQNRITVGVVSSSGDDAAERKDGASTLYFVGVLEDLEAATSNKKIVAMMG
jgi:PAS domain S-box-containing protein